MGLSHLILFSTVLCLFLAKSKLFDHIIYFVILLFCYSCLSGRGQVWSLILTDDAAFVFHWLFLLFPIKGFINKLFPSPLALEQCLFWLFTTGFSTSHVGVFTPGSFGAFISEPAMFSHLVWFV